MPPPVCVPCKVEFRCDKNGVPYVQTTNGNPYQVWDSDRWKCPSCGALVLSGFGMKPYLFKHDPHFADWYSRIQEDPNIVVEKGHGDR